MRNLIKKAPPEKTLTPAQKLRELESKIELDEVARAAAFEREQTEHERNQWRRNVSEVEEIREKSAKVSLWQARGRKAVPYVPLVLVNSAALQGQFDWALGHLAIGDAETIIRYFAAAIYAIAVESIALFLQYYANRALKNRDSAGLLYLSALLVAGFVSTINFSHYHVENAPLWDLNQQATAYAFAMCSLISPWLWRIHSRAEHREALKAAGEIDSRGVKLSLSRKIWHPIRSVQVISFNSWTGETNPAKAVEAWELHKAEKAAAEEATKITKKAAKIKKAEEASKPKVTLKSHKDKTPRRNEVPGGDLANHPKYAEGVEIYKLSLKGPGRPMSQRDLAKALNMANRQLASKIIGDVKSEIHNGLRPAS